MNKYICALKNYLNFNGRSRRSEFWTFISVNFFVAFCLGFGGFFFAGNTISFFFNGVFLFFSIVTFIPSITISVRRLHDTSRSGWFLLLLLLPGLGEIILLIFMLEDSSPAYNDYGEYPKFEYLY